MKSIAVIRPGSLKTSSEAEKALLDVIDVPDAPLGAHDVRIKVAYCAICGSDPHVVENIFGRTPPYGIGHEISGVVVELGSEATVKGLKVGDRVAGNFLRACGTCYNCQNGHPEFCTNVVDEGSRPGMAQYVVWDESQVWKIPDHLSLRQACLLEPTSIAVRVSDHTKLNVGQRVAIQGGGPIGLLCTQIMKKKGAVDLTVIEPNASRRVLASKYGAEHILDPKVCDVKNRCMEITGGHGFDVIIECTGIGPIAGIPLQIAAPGAHVLYIGMYDESFSFPIPMTDTFHNRNLTLTATKVAPYCFPRALQILPYLDLDDFTQISFPLEKVNEAFAVHFSGKYPKVMICCNDDLAER